MFLFLIFFVTLAFAQDPAVEEFILGSKTFSADVYNEFLLNNENNFLISPFSAEIVLALTQTGAKDTTAEEIRTSLHLPNTEEEVETAVAAILPTISNKKLVLKTANKIYVEQNYLIEENFQTVAKTVYDADFENIEFQETAEAAQGINQWVEEHTNGKIHDLVSADSLDPDSKVVLINALYFQANWSRPFFTDYTKKANFFKSSDSVVDVVMMNHESIKANYFESEELDAKVLELPFQGEEASMIFVLPNQIEGLGLIEKQFAAALKSFQYSKQIVQVSLPKFKIESTIHFDEILKRLGVSKAFDPMEADFSGISGAKGELFINQVTQKTFIDVNELGVEAAAATIVDAADSLPPPANVFFVADHPFAFYIKVDDIVLFEGRVLIPEY